MRPFALAATLAATFLAVAPARAEEPASDDAEKAPEVKAEPEKTEPVRSYPPPVARWGVIGVGLATTAFFYGAGAGMSYAFPDAPGARDLRTPIVGPWMAIANNGCSVGDDDCSRVWIVMRSIVTGIGGLAQAGGLLVALEGVFMPTQYAPEGATPARRAPKSSPPAETPPSSDPPKSNDKNLFWIPTPMALGERGVGLGVVGKF